MIVRDGYFPPRQRGEERDAAWDNGAEGNIKELGTSTSDKIFSL